MVGTMEVERKWLVTILFILTAVKIPRLHHLRQHHIATRLGTFGIAHRIEKRWILAKTDEHGSFTNCQVLRLLIKIGIGSRFDTDRIV